MALNDKFKSIKNFFTNGDDNDYYDDDRYEDEYDDEPPVAPETVAPAASPVSQVSRAGGYNTVAQQRNTMKVVVVKPREFEDSEGIATELRNLRPVVINFENTEERIANRIIDFISGTAYAIDGKIEQIGKGIFICTPMNISVDHNERLQADLADRLAWKEPQA